MTFFSSSFAVLSLGLFSAASPVAQSAEMAVRDTDPNTSDLRRLPGDMGANDEDLANLINEILDDVNGALNKLIPKLGLDGLLTPVDTAVSGLLTSLNASLAPDLLTALQPL
ncbi:hypothetical protein DFH08DRAFT_801320 [Mycena albidolilacea]|uniref:Uncharacterized protein n=1 Tax=Mycena albidolilacea TaxID=1033008 RepID=A0AAD7AIC3_9AGAR|nr:hypothetical protein DFH08DRAFT_801320 [Mycena albidolilacea]